MGLDPGGIHQEKLGTGVAGGEENRHPSTKGMRHYARVLYAQVLAKCLKELRVQLHAPDRVRLFRRPEAREIQCVHAVLAGKDRDQAVKDAVVATPAVEHQNRAPLPGQLVKDILIPISV